MLKRKIDQYLTQWKAEEDRLPLIVKGARQVGKTSSVMAFAKANYKHVVPVNFVIEKKYEHIFDDGYDVESVVATRTLASTADSIPFLTSSHSCCVASWNKNEMRVVLLFRYH